ncbi:uncharacterized protein LOC118753624 [Rhagoletis pomonella]|uniref:uncharacterized protein LOC118753465 n=1 Tax=Rhagoletis pomonella TaxID=28610 RepID=UPI00177C4FE4|nr:uncharacterized protein LOC118753465 [Rhagoletis pomonella]XP_036344263.1 uncharacterized protein LOC118753489 [Rhagoletis pomonella]XP_036344359.1 uncharacterized protein LOC118753583 [Rhagoletis pomonella]XP_036344393.1 uncharacterized protein LOC118753624 [Rhagoletis pomonella]
MENSSGKRRRNRWEEGGEKALLQIWEEKVDKLRAFKKNHHVLIEMVAEMELMDYYYNMRDIKTKMQNMVARYRKERKLVKSGMPSVWDYYEEMHAIMTRYESNNSEILANCRSFSAGNEY